VWRRLSDSPTDIRRVRVTPILETAVETERVVTIRFMDQLCGQAKPGQFVMVWIPGVDEVPMSLSYIDPSGFCGITVEKVGAATAALHSMRRGEAIGVRGPFGKPFTETAGRLLLVGGGCGVAPLAPLAERLAHSGSEATVIVGAKTRTELVFLERLKRSISKSKARIIAATEDGSYGWKGTAPDVLEATLRERRFDRIYTCGREMMIRKVFEIAERHSTPVEASLVRYMKCAVGICGQCVLDPLGLTTCTDGPVFDSEVLRKISDLGLWYRDASGSKIPVES
jgi:dihydroorotate dehydrogenase electron transfer subunit